MIILTEYNLMDDQYDKSDGELYQEEKTPVQIKYFDFLLSSSREPQIISDN